MMTGVIEVHDDERQRYRFGVNVALGVQQLALAAGAFVFPANDPMFVAWIVAYFAWAVHFGFSTVMFVAGAFLHCQRCRCSVSLSDYALLGGRGALHRPLCDRCRYE